MENSIVYIVGGIFAAVAIGFGGMWIGRYMKGSIKLNMNNTAVESGEALSGTVEITFKKPMQSNKLQVSLVATERVERTVNGKRKRESRTIFNNTVMLEDAKSYSAPQTVIYDYSINAPTGSEATSNKITGVAGTLFDAASRFAGNQRYVEWALIARLDAPGLDLVRSENVSVNVAL